MAERPARVLVVEDSALVAMAIEAALADRGFATIVAGSVAVARERLGHARLAAAVLDWRLPDGDTLELARELELRGCPVAMCTGVGSGEVPDGYPCTRRFTKPIEAATLAAWVSEVTAPGGPCNPPP